MRKLIIAIAAAVATVGVVSVAALTPSAEAATGGWRSMKFQGHSYAVVCEAGRVGGRPMVTCMRLHDKKQAVVRSGSGRGFRVYNWPDPAVDGRAPRLFQGETWNWYQADLSCLGVSGGVQCENGIGHGFIVTYQTITAY